jgi:hypothetical protein
MAPCQARTMGDAMNDHGWLPTRRAGNGTLIGSGAGRAAQENAR